MNRRGFLRAAGATGLLLVWRSPEAWAAIEAADDLDGMIGAALKTRRRLKFKYHGHVRVVEPHAIGRLSGDRRALLAWQVSGGSASEPPPGWRTFVLAEVTRCKLTAKTFTPRADYDAATSNLKKIDAEVSRNPRTRSK